MIIFFCCCWYFHRSAKCGAATTFPVKFSKTYCNVRYVIEMNIHFGVSRTHRSYYHFNAVILYPFAKIAIYFKSIQYRNEMKFMGFSYRWISIFVIHAMLCDCDYDYKAKCDRWNIVAKEKISCRCDVSFFGKFVIDSRMSFGLLPSDALTALFCKYKMKMNIRERIMRLVAYRHSMSWHRWIINENGIRTITADILEFNSIVTATVKAQANAIANNNNNINFNRGKSCLLKLSLEIWE